MSGEPTPFDPLPKTCCNTSALAFVQAFGPDVGSDCPLYVRFRCPDCTTEHTLKLRPAPDLFRNVPLIATATTLHRADCPSARKGGARIDHGQPLWDVLRTNILYDDRFVPCPRCLGRDADHYLRYGR